MPLPAAILPFLLTNWKEILQGIGIAIIVFLSWWFFIHNPKVIKGLEEDKAELQRQVEACKSAVTLLDDIQKGKVKIDAETDEKVKAIQQAVVPRRTVLIVGGLPLPSKPGMPNTPNGAKTNATGSGK